MFKAAEELGRRQAFDDNQQRPTRTRKDTDYVHHTASKINDLLLGAQVYNVIPEKIFLTAMVPHADELMSYLTEQITAKKGLKFFGDQGVAALEKELRQLLY
eukprot:2135098-Ditylum_brightwellii.AAC.1